MLDKLLNFNPWIVLIVAGVCEIAFTTCMKLSQGFTQWLFVGLFLIASLLSFGGLTLAVRSLPLGTAYAIWTGMGAAGTTIIGMVFFGDPASWTRILLLIVLIGSLVGLKLI